MVLGIGGFFTAIVFLPSTMLLFVGMLPTLVAGVVDRGGKGTKALTVGSMNFAGCCPFLLDLWAKGHNADVVVSIITNPQTIVVIYAAAGIGYLISWAMSGIVGTMMVQRGGGRLRDIERRQKALVSRWGPEVTGDLVLDPYGFPVDSQERGAGAKEDK